MCFLSQCDVVPRFVVCWSADLRLTRGHHGAQRGAHAHARRRRGLPAGAALPARGACRGAPILGVHARGVLWSQRGEPLDDLVQRAMKHAKFENILKHFKPP